MNSQPLADLAAAPKVIGAKQTARAVEKGVAVKVYLGGDADKHVILPLMDLCKNKGVAVDDSFKMAELGKACGIAVSAAAVAVVK